MWGQLRFEPGDKVHLTLDGTLTQEPYEVPERFPLLLGRLGTGDRCTLIDCFSHVDTHFRDDTYYRTHIYSSYLLGGANISSDADLRFNSLDLHFSHLEHWFPSPYSLRYKKSSFSKALLSFLPLELSIRVVWRDVAVNVSTSCVREFPSVAGETETRWKYHYRLHVAPENEQALEWFLEVAASLRQCFIYLVGAGIFTLSVVLYDRKGKDSESFRELHLYLPVDVPTVIRVEPHLYCTCFENFGSYFQSFLRNWFTKKQELQVVVDSYSETLLNDGAIEETIFLRVVQSLEHFHGLIEPSRDRYCSRTEWRSFLCWLKESAPEIGPPQNSAAEKRSIRDIILGRVIGLNKLSFRSRLEALVKAIPEPWLTPILGNPLHLDEEIEHFLKLTESTRNFLTHYNKKEKKKAASGQALEELTIRNWAVLSYWIAKYLGVEEDVAGRMALQSSRAMFLVSPRSGL